MKIIVAGGRDFNDYEFMCEKLDYFFQNINKDKLVIVNGDGPGLWDKIKKCYVTEGADQLAKKYANERGIPLEEYPPDWNKHGRAAGPIRNEQMARVGHALVAFWDGKSSGTGGMIKLAETYKLKIRVVNY